MRRRASQIEQEIRSAEVATVEDAETLCLAASVAVRTAELIVLEAYLAYTEEEGALA